MSAKKSPSQNALEMFTAIKQQLANHHEQNIEVFTEFDRLQDQLRVAEENLKSAVRESGEPIKNDHFIVKASRSFKKWFDWNAIKEAAKKGELEVIEARAVKSVEVDPKVMQELVMEGKIRAEIVQTSFREQELTTRVTIGEIKE